MNMNVKLDGEDEQAVHFPNRATIALQSTPAAYINLNIVNPNLSNPGYILNPVSSVPQNLVAYQSPVTLQSYITLQEADGNIVNNLQVGVPVPIGLPVPAELLQNPNLVNTSIIIGNEDCNQPVIFKPATNNVSEPNDIKISYMPKPMIQDVKSGVVANDENMRLHDMTAMNMDNVLKKPCPLEMSIKAANIDLEFEKCDSEDLIPENNGISQPGNYPLMHKMPGQDGLAENMVLNVPVKMNDKPLLEHQVSVPEPEVKKQKTEITWENNSLQSQATANEFRESLICEVEEANEDEDEDEEEEEDEDEDEDERDGSSDENETLPLSSVLLKLRRVQEDEEEDDPGARKKKDSKDQSSLAANKSRKESDQSDWKKFLKVRRCCSRRECFKNISLKDQKTAHKNFYDLESAAKQDAYLISCIEHVQAKKSLPGNSTKENEEEEEEDDDDDDDDDENEKKKTATENDEKTILEAANIQLEIENESNGNQMLSDEIQKAIKESLRDCMANQIVNKEEEKVTKKSEDEREKYATDEEEERKIHNWSYYFVVDRCRRRVCLQFLLKLFRITKNRIKGLQQKILSGQCLSDDSSTFTTNDETFDVWDFARIHLNTLSSEEYPGCRSIPRHRFLSNETTVERLFDVFRAFYKERAGKEPKVKLTSYRRFLKNDVRVSVSRSKGGCCLECDTAAEAAKKSRKGAKTAAASNNVAKLDRSFQARKKARRKGDASTDSECSSDDEPLVKRRNLKLKISLKGNRLDNSDSWEDGKKTKKKCKRETKGKGNSVRGRDVWSLMLLHLETMPYKICKNCLSRKRHRFFDASMTKQALYEDYRRYFLKETNSELGLGFTMYEKYFDRNCGYTIGDVDVNSPVCPKCALEPPKPDASKWSKKCSKNSNNNVRSSKHDESLS